MSHNSKSAIAACFATVFIITATVSLAQTGGALPFGATSAVVR